MGGNKQARKPETGRKSGNRESAKRAKARKKANSDIVTLSEAKDLFGRNPGPVDSSLALRMTKVGSD